MLPIEKLPSDIYGLDYIPRFRDGEFGIDNPNDEDCIERYHFRDVFTGQRSASQFSHNNHEVIRGLMREMDNKCQFILEIGVDNFQHSSTKTFINEKPNDCIYLGVDIKDKSYLNNASNNVFTIQTDSIDRSRIESQMLGMGYNKIDILHIDGWHSVNHVINDWKFARRLSPHGVVVLHDTSVFPGPHVVFEAISDKLFKKEKLFADDEFDWGMGVARHVAPIL